MQVLETPARISNHSCPICGGQEVSTLFSAPDRFHLRRDLYSLVRCSSCGCSWTGNPPLPEEMAHHYDADYYRIVGAAGESSDGKRWRRESEVILRYKQGGSLLDIGCSSGGFLRTLKNAQWTLYGVEVDESMADRARSMAGAEVFAGDAECAPFADNSFDVITSFDVLEHIYDPSRLLKRVMAWLRPGGIYYAVVPNIQSWEARIFKGYWYGLEFPRHIFHFSPDALRNVMARAGLEEVSITTTPVTYVARSFGYVYAALLATAGIDPTSQARAEAPGFAWRAIRKGLNAALITPAGYLASWAGAGASIDAVFRKPVN